MHSLCGELRKFIRDTTKELTEDSVLKVVKDINYQFHKIHDEFYGNEIYMGICHNSLFL